MVNFDGLLARYLGLADALGISLSSVRSAPLVTGLVASDGAHYITSSQDRDAPKQLCKPVEMGGIAEGSDPSETILRTQDGHPAALVSRYGRGKVVQYLISPKIWLNEVFGHGRGLDDVFWKSIVWAARKPFAMLAMPPFVTARVDDGVGSHSDFGYVGVYNLHGYLPSIGLFLDEMDDRKGEIVRQYAELGTAEFAAHAFRYEDLILFDYHRGPYSAEQLEENLARVDERFQRWGVQPARIINAHYGEWSERSVEMLQSRGHDFVMCWRLPDELALGLHRDWRPAPYGNYGFLFDQLPGHPGMYALFCAPDRPDSKVYLPDKEHFVLTRGMYKDDVDYLWRHTSFREESPVNDIEGAAQAASRSIRLGLDSLFFGSFTTHEQRITALSLEELDAILSRVDELTSGYEKIYKGHDAIAQYMKNRRQAWIVCACAAPGSGKVTVDLAGETEVPLQVYLFSDEGEEIRYELREISAFSGSTSVPLEMG